jgi:AraC-like DNA-binding protein
MMMEQMQFTAMVLMAWLTAKLLMLPVKAVGKASLGKARWLAAACTFLLAVQFLLQYTLHLRATGHVAQALLLNLSVFIPCSALLSLAVSYVLQREGVTRIDRWIGLPVWLCALGLLAFGLADGSEPMENETTRLKWAEAGAGVLYAGMQLYYFSRHMHELRRLRNTLANYYDLDTGGLLSWMEISIVMLALIALTVPFIIFTNGWWLPLFSLVIFLSICYMIDRFCLYVVSSTPKKVKEAEANAEEVEKEERATASDNNGHTKHNDLVAAEHMRRVEVAVEQWMERGAHLRCGINMPDAADEMGLPQYLLSAWLKQRELRYSDWLTQLRIQEAKHMLLKHREWNDETIAQHCGFSDRSYFQKKFKEYTGLSPLDYRDKVQ